ncbi:hypothetical protein IJO12_07515 [bacterium]|nr:hypothetical protein [bacterium]
MIDPEEIAKLKEYFDKLIKVINSQAVLSLGSTKFVDKQKIDDVLCCIDINFPKKLVEFNKKYGAVDSNIKSFKIYQEMINNIKIKPIIGKSNYAVRYNEVQVLIDRLGRSFSSDLKYIQDHYPDFN